MLMGIGAGFVGSEMFTFLYRHKSNLRRTHLALAGILVLYASQRFIDALSFNLSVGVLIGIFSFHVINDDLRQVIEELKLYKTRKEPDPSITGMIKKQLIKLLEI